MDRKKLGLAAAAGVAVIAIGTGVSIAASGDDEPLTGSTLDQATAAALAHVGGGTVVESEVGDGGAAYEVEVRLDDGSVVEVALDADFNVLGSTADDDGAGAEDDAGEAGPDD